jgi:hypothetical protein
MFNNNGSNSGCPSEKNEPSELTLVPGVPSIRRTTMKGIRGNSIGPSIIIVAEVSMDHNPRFIDIRWVVR